MKFSLQKLVFNPEKSELSGQIEFDTCKLNTLYSIGIRVVTVLKIGRKVDRKNQCRVFLIQFMRIAKGQIEMPPQVSENLTIYEDSTPLMHDFQVKISNQARH